eukprot:1021627-Amorphochlora_amoeboformis.AAC.3
MTSIHIYPTIYGFSYTSHVSMLTYLLHFLYSGRYILPSSHPRSTPVHLKGHASPPSNARTPPDSEFVPAKSQSFPPQRFGIFDSIYTEGEYDYARNER